MHNIKQTMGLSLLVNTRFMQHCSAQKQFFWGDDGKSRRFELRAAQFLLAGTCAHMLAIIRPSTLMNHNYFPYLIPLDYRLYGIGLVLLVLAIKMLRHQNLMFNKISYASRYVLVAFRPLSIFCLHGSNLIHGM